MKKNKLLILSIALFTLTGCEETDLSLSSTTNTEDINSANSEISNDITEDTSSSDSTTSASSITEDTFKTRLKTSLKSMNKAKGMQIDATSFNFATSATLFESKKYYTDKTFMTIDKSKGTDGKDDLSTTNAELNISNATSTMLYNGLDEESVDDLEMYTYYKSDVVAKYNTTLNDEIEDTTLPASINYLDGDLDEDAFDVTVEVDYEQLIESLASIPDFSISQKDVAFKAYLDNNVAYLDLDDTNMVSLINQVLNTKDEEMTLPDDLKYVKASNAIDEYYKDDVTDEELDEMVDELFSSDSTTSTSTISSLTKNLFSYSKDEENVYLNVTLSSTVFKMMPTIIGMLFTSLVPPQYIDIYTEMINTLQKVVSATDLKTCTLSLAFNDSGLKYINIDLDFASKSTANPVALIDYEDQAEYAITSLYLTSYSFKLSSKVNFSFSDTPLTVTKPDTTNHTYFEVNE